MTAELLVISSQCTGKADGQPHGLS